MADGCGFQACPDVMVTLDVGASLRSSCVCPSDYYMDNGACTLCTDGMACEEAGQSLTTLSLAAGYWRTSRTSRVMVECEHPDLCVGGKMNVTGTPVDLCLPNQVRGVVRGCGSWIALFVERKCFVYSRWSCGEVLVIVN